MSEVSLCNKYFEYKAYNNLRVGLLGTAMHCSNDLHGIWKSSIRSRGVSWPRPALGFRLCRQRHQPLEVRDRGALPAEMTMEERCWSLASQWDLRLEDIGRYFPSLRYLWYLRFTDISRLWTSDDLRVFQRAPSGTGRFKRTTGCWLSSRTGGAASLEFSRPNWHFFSDWMMMIHGTWMHRVDFAGFAAAATRQSTFLPIRPSWSPWKTTSGWSRTKAK